MTERKSTSKKEWFKSVRSVIDGPAKVQYQYVINTRFGGEDQYQERLIDTDDAEYWKQAWEVLVKRWRSVALSESTDEIQAASRTMGQTRLDPKSGANGLSQFLARYQAAMGGPHPTGAAGPD